MNVSTICCSLDVFSIVGLVFCEPVFSFLWNFLRSLARHVFTLFLCVSYFLISFKPLWTKSYRNLSSLSAFLLLNISLSLFLFLFLILLFMMTFSLPSLKL